MMTGRVIPGLAILAALLAGCASDDGGKVTTVRKTYNDPLLDRYASNFQYEKGEDGASRITSNKRSGFEGGRASGFDRGYKTHGVLPNERKKMPWWGSKGYEKQAWGGRKSATNADRYSDLGSRRAGDGGSMARMGAATYSNAAGNYRTGRSSSGGANVATGANSMVAGQGGPYSKPKIVGWEEQRRMTVEQTKGLLGR